MEELKQRINDALEAELANIYSERGITSGDISPLQAIEWDEVTSKAAYLFLDLIEWNEGIIPF